MRPEVDINIDMPIIAVMVVVTAMTTAMTIVSTPMTATVTTARFVGMAVHHPAHARFASAPHSTGEGVSRLLKVKPTGSPLLLGACHGAPAAQYPLC
tara:strand:+ start:164179 stop:164469 length:291 start_codon:yes stop_codon:yes gene_type:complete